MTKPELEKLRDKLAKRSHFEIYGRCIDYNPEDRFGTIVAFKEGFNSALELMWPCVEALEFYANDDWYHRNEQGYFPIVGDNGTTADFALKELNEKYGEKND